MSFLKHLLQEYREPQHRQQNPEQHRPAAQHTPAHGCGSQITLDKVREALHDPDDEHDPYKPDRDDHVVSEQEQPDFDVAADATTVDDVLQATRRYLDAEISKEQDRVDWTTEYKFEKVIQHPKGNHLPQFSSAEELQSISNAHDLLIPLKRLGMAVDKNVMDRIKAGLGPRPFESVDLIQELRIEPRPRVDSGQLLYAEETYDELLAVLQAWNMRVGKEVDVGQARQTLLEALEARCRLIHQVEVGGHNEVLQKQCVSLRQAVHAFRPELENFRSKDLIDQLVIMVAHNGIAYPGLDDELRDLVIKTVFREFRSKIYLGEEHTARRVQLDAEIQRARLQDDSSEEANLLEGRRKLDKESCNQASEQVRTAIKAARKQLHGMVLEDLQALTELQAAQKWAACGIMKAPATLLAQSCIESEDAMDTILQGWDVNIDNVVKAASQSMHTMCRLDADNRRQAKKLAGLDVPKAERKSVMERRRRDHRTPLIMNEVQNQRSQIQDLSRSVSGRMEGLHSNLDHALGAALTSSRTHDALLARVDEGDYHDTEETLCMVKERKLGGEIAGEVVGETRRREGRKE
ncbi:hypothetical protein GRF29_69g1273191 [Pseudopithomyces chartarum]|uniref:Uncharacterized protein n=1 Tax=Pseudopithomyces chartarum TaxID=1892770 RepID=A0AAN6LXY5_9PLEO|nr:hypothetical protein GRF29_69g1273191 [Pseudopithomyces chartarum]